MSTNIFQGSDGHYFIASSHSLSELNYDITQTHMLSCGAGGHGEAPSAASDAAALSSALVESGLVQQPNLRLCCLQDECSTEGLRAAFKTKASLVGENGLFLFAYHGSAVATNATPSLVSSTYRADSSDTHIRATTIRRWMEELGDKKPNRILVFLDCPLASEIATSLTGPLPVAGVQKICVFCANTPATLSLLTCTLDHSVFTYFAMWAFKEHTPASGLRSQRTIYIRTISDRIKECCQALNSLCLSETCSNGTAPTVVTTTIQPFLPFQRLQKHHAGQDMVDGVEGDGAIAAALGRFTFLETHYKTGWWQPKMKLCEQVHCWLHYLRQNPTSPLHVLNTHKFLGRQEVQATLHRLVLYSLALLQESNKKNSTADPNTLILLYVLAAGVLEHVTGSDVEATAEQFPLSCEAYCLALARNKLSSSKINELATKIRKQENN